MLNRLAIMLLLVLLAPAAVPASLIQLPQTGQTGCWAEPGDSIDCEGTGQDGNFQAGKPWPSSRFTDNANGTLTDTLTGLVWLKNANCFGAVTWDQALAAAATLANSACGLADSSAAGSWRLPNSVEMQSIEGPSASDTKPPLADNNQFTNVQFNGWYWTSTTYVPTPQYAWGLLMIAGEIKHVPDDKSATKNFMLVRDPS